MKTDIQARQDIELLINTFYDKVKQNPFIGYIFTDVAQMNWETHLPVMYDFWESVLLDGTAYKGNAMQKHIALHQKVKLTVAHFTEWLRLFHETVDELFAGLKAEEAKMRASGIAQIIQFKLNSHEKISL